MKHPSPEIWMSFLYDDGLTEAQTNECHVHLETCAECRSQVTEWGQARKALDRWTVPVIPKRAQEWKWGIAASLILGVGIGIGRLAGPGVDVERMSAFIEAKVQEAVKREVKAGRELERKEILALLRGIEQQRAVDYAALRRDLETVAVQAEDKIQSTQQELGQLATLTQNNFENK